MVCNSRLLQINFNEGKKRRSHNMHRNQIQDDRKKEEAILDKNSESVNYPPVCVDLDYDSLLINSHLVESCNWFFQGFTSTDAKELLKKTPVGTFILRNSSDPKFIYCLSLNTKRGPTSIRIKYSRGLFQLDCEEHVKKVLPRFENVIALVDFHVTVSKSKLVEYQRVLSKKKDEKIEVTLLKPALHETGSLKHLSRLAINRSLSENHIPARSTDVLPIPTSLKQYLREYTYKV